MDEKIINEAMDNRFDGVESCVIVEELLELEADVKQLKEKLEIYKYTDANIYHAYNRGYDNGAKQTKGKEI